MSVVDTPSDEGRGRVDETTSLLGGRTQGEAQGVTSEVVPMRYRESQVTILSLDSSAYELFSQAIYRELQRLASKLLKET